MATKPIVRLVDVGSTEVSVQIAIETAKYLREGQSLTVEIEGHSAPADVRAIVPVGDIASGVRAAEVGESMVSPRMARTLLDQLREHESGEKRPHVENLSTREKEVLRLVVEGKDNATIAATLRAMSSGRSAASGRRRESSTLRATRSTSAR